MPSVCAAPKFFLYILPSVGFHSSRPWEMKCLSVTVLMDPRGVVWFSHPITQDRAVLRARPCTSGNSDGWFALSVWAALGTHPLSSYHLGMRQLKASGNLGFMDISQRPQPGSICFLWQVSTTPACLPGCGPCTRALALTADSVGKMHLLLRKQQPLYRDGGGSGKWG